MIVANGATDVTTYWVLRDSTLHAPKTDVTITDIDLYYVEQGAAISAKADATALAAADSAHSDNKAFHVGQGLYRIDWPDAAFDGGAGKVVTLIVVCSGVDTTYLEVELSPAVNVTQISGDATAADNLEAACDGGTYNLGGGAIVAASVTAGVTASTVSDKTGYALTVAYDAAKTAATQASVDTMAGYIDTEVAAIKAKTDNLPADPADQSAVEAAIVAAVTGLATSAEVAALNDVTAADVVAAIDAAVPAVNVKQINDVAVLGSGVAGDEWGPA